MNFLVLPHQLFDVIYLPKVSEISRVYLYEHPQYFTKYNFNQKKLVLHRASMKYYGDYLSKHGYKVTYLEFRDKLPNEQFVLFDPVDKIKIPKSIFLESPNFLLSKKSYQKYKSKTKSFIFYHFYMNGKKEIDIIPNIKSKDSENQQSIPQKTKLDIPKNPTIGTEDKKYIKEAIKYVSKYFGDNYGDCDGFNYPVTHKTSHKWLSHFIKHKLANFGAYQDFIIPGQPILYHSLLSPVINVGLLNPTEIIDKLRPLKSKIPMNSYEGYIRQLFWREYQRYCYIHYDFKGKNYFGNNKKLNKKWYTGETGILPVDDAIKEGFKTGYLHHIIRLMVVGNWMNLSGIKPSDGFRWFMEFSCDSYEWVMCQNVLDMVFCVSGGDTMRKPYISSSSYILKMSHYKKGDWSTIWNEQFRQFVVSNKDKLHKFRYHFPFLKKMTLKKSR